MPTNKNAFVRYMIIDRCLRGATRRQHPVTKAELKAEILEQRQMRVSDSTIEKDLYNLRHDSDIRLFLPIVSKVRSSDSLRGYVYTDPEFNICQAIEKAYYAGG